MLFLTAGAGVSPRAADYNPTSNEQQVCSDEEGLVSLDGQVWAYEDCDDNADDIDAEAAVANTESHQENEDVRAACDQLPAADKTAMQKQLLGKLGGKSAFALQELKRIAEENNNTTHHNANNNNNQRHVGSIPAQYANTSGKVIPLNDYAGAEEGLPQYKVLQSLNAQVSPPAAGHKTMKGGHRNGPGGVGMFTQTRNSGSNMNLSHDPPSHRNPFAPKQGGSNAANQGSGNANQNMGSADIRALTLNVQALTRTVEVQNDMLIALYTQILALKRVAQDQQDNACNHSGPGNSRSLSPAELQFPLMTPSPHMAANIERLDSAAQSNAPSRGMNEVNFPAVFVVPAQKFFLCYTCAQTNLSTDRGVFSLPSTRCSTQSRTASATPSTRFCTRLPTSTARAPAQWTPAARNHLWTVLVLLTRITQEL